MWFSAFRWGQLLQQEWKSNQLLRAEPDPWFWGVTRPPRVLIDAHQAGSRGLGGRGGPGCGCPVLSRLRCSATLVKRR